jgi:hypothetical protein
MKLAGTKFKFARHGKSGQEMSELLPHLARVADELCIVRSVHTEEINHAPAQMFLHTGFGRGGRPSMGAWTVYGLGSVTKDLPAYVVLLSGPLGGAGTSLWSAGFLPSVYQGVQFRSSGEVVPFLSNPAGHSAADRRQVLDAVAELNRQQHERTGDPETETRIRQYEMAFRMQTSVPDLMDISKEPAAIRDSYGAVPGKASFAGNCLLARRLIERGVRVVELYDADWDHHGNIAGRLPAKCKDVDRATAALVRDLKQRGLLDETLIIWGSEFGRTPLRQNENGTKASPGRDHHKDAFTMWLAGGGVRGGGRRGQDRRVRLQRGGEAGACSRPERDRAAPARAEPREAHLQVPGSRVPPDGRNRSYNCFVQMLGQSPGYRGGAGQERRGGVTSAGGQFPSPASALSGTSSVAFRSGQSRLLGAGRRLGRPGADTQHGYQGQVVTGRPRWRVADSTRYVARCQGWRTV